MIAPANIMPIRQLIIVFKYVLLDIMVKTMFVIQIVSMVLLIL